MMCAVNQRVLWSVDPVVSCLDATCVPARGRGDVLTIPDEAGVSRQNIGGRAR